MSNDFLNGKITPETAAILKTKGIDPSALKSSDKQALLSSLSPRDAEKINALLNDKEALQGLLASDRAKAVINQLFGGAK